MPKTPIPAIWKPVPRPTPEGTKTILENLGVSGRAAEQFVAEFIDDEFMKQITDEGLLKQIYPSGVPVVALKKLRPVQDAQAIQTVCPFHYGRSIASLT